RAAWGRHMKNYSIVRIGNEYVVQAGDESVLKISSRRRAARLVTDAEELLDSEPVLPAQTLPEQALPEQAAPSIACDSIPDPPEVP
ncbi:hypothetical protein, partial [Bradyrhizobium sp.]|uniref:hypothetical protein n=1 Tax=Bradyrhizobium sp. TaxID=376 RepID=UPI003C1FF8C7